MGCGASQEVTNGTASPQQKGEQNETTTHGGEQGEDEEYLRECNGFMRETKDGKVVRATDRNEGRPEDNEMFGLAEAGPGEQTMAVKPWLGAIVAPTNPPANNPAEPDQRLELEHVYGIRVEDCRSHLFYINPQEIVYMIAALGIVMNKGTKVQRYFGAGEKKTAKGHTDDIRSLAVCPKRELVATGEVGAQPKVFVWRAADSSIVQQFKLPRGARAATAVSFNKTATLLAVTADDNDHTLYVYDITKGGAPIYTTKTGPDPIMAMEFSKHDENLLAAAGKRGVVFFTVNGDTKKGQFKGAEMVDMASLAWDTAGTCITGSSKGDLYIWKGGAVADVKNVHAGVVHSVQAADGKFFTSGKDNQLCVLDNTGNLINKIELPSFAKSIDVQGNNILLALRNASILEVSFDGKVQSTIIEGHSDGETWGVAIDPASGFVLTTGDDNSIKAWDPKAKKCVGKGTLNTAAGPKKKTGGASTLSQYPPNQCARAIAVGKNGHVVVGLNNGELHIRAGASSLDQVVAKKTDSKEWIEAISFSPDGSKLAVGSHDNNIYIYDVNNGYNLLTTLRAHNSFITSLDWSNDGNYIHSVCGAYELLFFNVQKGAQEKSGATALKDEDWATWSIKLGWPVQGVFPPGMVDYTHINGVHRSHNKQLLLTSDDWGLVNLFRYPVAAEGNKSYSYRGHSEHVVRAIFTPDDKHVFSVGGYDKAVMQWKVL
eukprot:TRINITY_DN5902_c0_g1_i1.p1 TRINITY_DN5902_c0_g1~~TRINITY_DN5902_c0_g1_i1.p1  ORF type:complete len:714 (-),score=190.86 TRINITY_DN5902_c0_g1_i1:151-2292(-)